VTGVLFHDQVVSAVVEAVDQFETVRDSITPAARRMNANRFSTQSFKTGLLDAVDGAIRKNGVARFADFEVRGAAGSAWLMTCPSEFT